ncbi:MAG TPA: sialidase family protein [Kribbella sp.]|nr:sialidase family protein [Kribbella sp.]
MFAAFDRPHKAGLLRSAAVWRLAPSSSISWGDDAGQTWHIGATTSRDDGTVIAQEVTVVELTDRRIRALARERGMDPASRAYATSSDGGATFEAPFQTMPGLVMPDLQGSMLPLSARD